MSISLLKSIYYSFKFKGKILIGHNTKIQADKNGRIIINKDGYLTIGVKTNLPQGTILEMGKDSIIKVNGKVHLYKGSKIVIGNNAILEIGDGTFINEHSKLVCQKKICIGDNCAIGWNVNILDTDYHNLINNGKENIKNKSIIIGNHVRIGCNCTILKGIEIGSNSVIGAQSLVNRNILSNTLNVGNPCSKIKDTVNWK
ncbi:acyltransferase [Clostridium coskatii]|uniref:acyltransferase n=1 Tax=Clostridium coskatii TaxID=1705578 RepID=UPI00178CB8D5|nr:acyltransferase [Clostridium coskatii]